MLLFNTDLCYCFQAQLVLLSLTVCFVSIPWTNSARASLNQKDPYPSVSLNRAFVNFRMPIQTIARGTLTNSAFPHENFLTRVQLGNEDFSTYTDKLNVEVTNNEEISRPQPQLGTEGKHTA